MIRLLKDNPLPQKCLINVVAFAPKALGTPFFKQLQLLFFQAFRIALYYELGNQSLSKVMEELEFSIDRYAFLLVRENMDVPELSLPEGYMIRDFLPGKDEEIWCEVRNAGFANLKGNETPVTPDMVEKLVESTDYIDGGMKILFDKDIPVGVVRGAKDEYEGAPIMNIGPLAILPGYQGRGLGRILLRAALHFAKRKSFQRTILSVNGENERAKSLSFTFRKGLSKWRA